MAYVIGTKKLTKKEEGLLSRFRESSVDMALYIYWDRRIDSVCDYETLMRASTAVHAVSLCLPGEDTDEHYMLEWASEALRCLAFEYTGAHL